MGYARCSPEKQDLTAQRDRLAELGVGADRIYLDHGLTGTTRAGPGLDQALAAVRSGGTLVVPEGTSAFGMRWGADRAVAAGYAGHLLLIELWACEPPLLWRHWVAEAEQYERA
ncbi:recombinase family protein [Saccharopolyspora sp. 5N102]|uniref:recombinase family protein n=1 Tax=Saccharopolyspora sp. 5N102 TaxID=3375155 RepID=UPI0037B0CD3A